MTQHFIVSATSNSARSTYIFLHPSEKHNASRYCYLSTSHLPYFAAIILGGLAGNAIADRNIKLPPIAYITLAFVFVASLCVQGYFMQNDMRALLLLANAITGASLAFALTVGGDFAQPTRASKTKLEKNS